VLVAAGDVLEWQVERVDNLIDRDPDVHELGRGVGGRF
jgi:hypothetical protein